MSYADDLRALADFYDTNPGLPTPDRSEVVYLGGDDASKQFVLRVYVPRDRVCTQRQVGTRVIPATVERVEPVYEWTCPDSVLRDLA